MLSEISQSQKDKYYVLLFTWDTESTQSILLKGEWFPGVGAGFDWKLLFTWYRVSILPDEKLCTTM